MTDLRARRGDDKTYQLTIRQANGVPLDLTGLELWFTVKRSYAHADSEAIAQRTVGSGITIVDGPAGRADVTLPAAATTDLPATATALVWDCQVKDPAGEIHTVDGGTLVVDPDVTRATA